MLINYDKINIYVPEVIGRKLTSDAQMFEIYKADGHSINMNRFLSLVIIGYFNVFEREQTELFNKVRNKLTFDDVDSGLLDDMAKNIARELCNRNDYEKLDKKTLKLSLKPTKNTAPMITQILELIGMDDYLSKYLCRLFTSYCEKSFSERERIVFKDKYETIREAIEKRQGLSLTTIWGQGRKHYILPYKFSIGKEELYNYILCCEYDEYNGKYLAVSFRLNRIDQIVYSSKVLSFPNEIIENIKKTEKYAPQFAINGDRESCVRLTEKGVELLSKIYIGRPMHDRVEKLENGWFYYYKCSEEQVFQYFKKFDGGEAEIIAPKEIRDRMMDFHTRAMKLYRQRRPNDECD